jgi:hypothetical protein
VEVQISFFWCLRPNPIPCRAIGGHVRLLALRVLAIESGAVK